MTPQQIIQKTTETIERLWAEHPGKPLFITLPHTDWNDLRSYLKATYGRVTKDADYHRENFLFSGEAIVGGSEYGGGVVE